MRRIPLKMIEDGSKFRMVGKMAVFTKINNLGMISIQGRQRGVYRQPVGRGQPGDGPGGADGHAHDRRGLLRRADRQRAGD